MHVPQVPHVPLRRLRNPDSTDVRQHFGPRWTGSMLIRQIGTGDAHELGLARGQGLAATDKAADPVGYEQHLG